MSRIVIGVRWFISPIKTDCSRSAWQRLVRRFYPSCLMGIDGCITSLIYWLTCISIDERGFGVGLHEVIVPPLQKIILNKLWYKHSGSSTARQYRLATTDCLLESLHPGKLEASHS